MTHNELSSKIIGCAIEVHRELGPGLLESIYEECLIHVLREHGLHVLAQQRVPLVFRGRLLSTPLRLDILVEDLVIVEVKAVETVHDIFLTTLLSYLRLSDKRLGLLINFHEARLVDGIRRVVNGLPEE
ncbi:MAG: GxxExxY protein [Flavobacteriales bacterium]|nr:GxxExxY protein [Flavobacteriales bacterium]MCB0787615.1 GxxExxY protein [Flavobacteriales bacterium]MCB0811103.1 GxxExxY protein [Flavobacteriales bacterium]